MHHSHSFLDVNIKIGHILFGQQEVFIWKPNETYIVQQKTEEVFKWVEEFYWYKISPELLCLLSLHLHLLIEESMQLWSFLRFTTHSAWKRKVFHGLFHHPKCNHTARHSLEQQKSMSLFSITQILASMEHHLSFSSGTNMIFNYKNCSSYSWRTSDGKSLQCMV